MLRINPAAHIMRKKIHETYEAMSEDERRAYEKKVKAETDKRRKEYIKQKQRVIRTVSASDRRSTGKAGEVTIRRHVEKSFRTPQRLQFGSELDGTTPLSFVVSSGGK